MYDYKVIPAPARVQKVKGLKTTPERFAHLLTEVLNLHGQDGWEYLRAETLPCEERKGLTGLRTSMQTVLILRRARPQAEPRLQQEFTTLHDDGARRPLPGVAPAALRAQPGSSAPSLRAARDLPPLRAPVPSIGEPSTAANDTRGEEPGITETDQGPRG